MHLPVSVSNMQVARVSIVLVALSLVPLCSAKCYEIMGFNSCSISEGAGGEETFPFTPEWWLINLYKQRPTINVLQNHILGNSVIGSAANRIPHLAEFKKLLETETFWNLFDQTINHLERVRNEPMELLLDENVKPMYDKSLDLYRSFRSHSKEIVNFLQETQLAGAYQGDILENFDTNIEHIRKIGKFLGNLPDVSTSGFFKMIESGVDPTMMKAVQLGLGL